ncbi:MAG: peptidase MA family metallohydrolase [Planctomycetota bacterium]
MLAVFLLSASIAGAGPAAPGLLPGYEEDRAETGPLLSRGWSPRDRERIAGRLPAILRSVEGKLGRRLGREFLTVLVPDRGEMVRVLERFGARLSGSSEPVVGMALTGPRCLIVREDLWRGAPIEETLAHEIAHLVIHRDPSARIPRWFDEGAAMWAAGQALDPELEAHLSLLAWLGLLYPVRTLEARFPADGVETSRAYGQSYLLVLYLVSRRGPGIVPELLDAFERGAAGVEPLEALNGGGLRGLERDYGSWVARRRPLLLALASRLDLWTTISLLALLAVLVGWARRRRKLRQLEREEGPSSEGPGGEEAEEEDTDEEDE